MKRLALVCAFLVCLVTPSRADTPSGGVPATPRLSAGVTLAGAPELVASSPKTAAGRPVVTGFEISGVAAIPGGPPSSPKIRLLGVAADFARLQFSVQLPGENGFRYLGSVLGDAMGRWAFSAPSPTGLITIRVGATSATGEWSGWSEPFVVEIDGATPLETMALQQGDQDYGGVQDTTIDAWNRGMNYGRSFDLLVRQGAVKNALLRFDVSPVPPSARVRKAVLALYVSGRTNPAPMTISAYGLLRPWDELTVNWSCYGACELWAAPGAAGPGADRLGTPTSSTVVHAAPGWITLDVTSLVAAWVASPEANHGLLLEGSGDAAVEYVLRSSEWLEVGRRPRLTITLRP